MSDTTSNGETIRVFLRNSGNANSFKKENSFHEKKLEAAIQEIVKLVARAAATPKITDDDPDQFGYFHVHDNTVSVLGTRGAGKTSFLLSLLGRLRKQMKDRESQSKAHVLDVLDPNLMEGPEIFLATIVAKINLAVVEFGGQHRQLPEPIGKKLMELGRAFRVLAPTKEWGKWLGNISDHDMFAREVLFDAHTGIRLARSMHEYIEAVCDYLKVDALVLPLDDVDTDIEGGWELLETVRRYLASSRLITIISGDMTLYRMLVRNHQWSKLNDIVLKELDKQEEFASQMQQLEEQYLKKLMPAEKRFYLFPINERIWGGTRVQVCWEEKSDDGKYIDLETVFSAFSKDAFLLSSVTADKCLNPAYSGGARLLPSTTRNLIRLLEALRPWYGKFAEKEPKPSESGMDDIMGVAFVFAHILSEQRISFDDLVRLARGQHMSWLAETVLKLREDSRNLWRLEASNNNDEKGEKLNQLALILQMFLHRAWRHLGVPIEYCIKVVAPCMLATRYGLNNKEELSKYARRLHLHQPEYSNDTANRLLAYKLTEKDANKKMLSGIMQVTGTVSKGSTLELLKGSLEAYRAGRPTGLQPLLEKYGVDAKGNSLSGEIAENILTQIGGQSGIKPFLKNASENASILLHFFLQKHPLNKSGAIGYFINFVGGLAVLSDILKLDHKKQPEAAEINRLYTLLQFRSADRTTLVETAESTPEVEEDAEIQVADGDRIWAVPELLCEALQDWHSVLMETRETEGGMLPVSVMSNAWARFDNNLLTLADSRQLPPRYRTVGTMLEIWSVAWLNSLLQEEVRFRVESGVDMKDVISKSIFSTNILTDCSRFFAAIEEITDTKQISYAYAWLHCPILLACLSPTSFASACATIEANTSKSAKGAKSSSNLIDKVKRYRKGFHWIGSSETDNIGHEMLCSLTIADFKLGKIEPKPDKGPTGGGSGTEPKSNPPSPSKTGLSKVTPKTGGPIPRKIDLSKLIIKK